MYSGYDFKNINNIAKAFEKGFDQLSDDNTSDSLAKASVLHASMEHFYRTLADACKQNSDAFMKLSVEKQLGIRI